MKRSWVITNFSLISRIDPGDHCFRYFDSLKNLLFLVFPFEPDSLLLNCMHDFLRMQNLVEPRLLGMSSKKRERGSAL